MKKVGEVNKNIVNHLNSNIPQAPIYIDEGLLVHLRDRGHSNMIPYFNKVGDMIQNATYIGQNTRHINSLEFIYVTDENVQIAIKLNISEGYYFVATMHEVTDSKINKRLKSGRIIEFNNRKS